MKPYLIVVGILGLFMAGFLAGANNPPLLVGGSTGKLVFPENATPATVSASSGALTMAAGGSNQNVVLTPSGTGIVTTAAMLNAGGRVDAGGRIRTTGNTAPSTGAGLESFYTGTAGGIVSFDRGGSAFTQFTLDGSTLALNATSGGSVSTGGSLSVTGNVNVSGVYQKGGTAGVGTGGSVTVCTSVSGGVCSTCTLQFTGGIRTGGNCPL